MQYKLQCYSTWTGSIRKGFLREESQYLRLSLTVRDGTGNTEMGFFFLPLPICVHYFIPENFSSEDAGLNYSRDRRF